MFIDVGVGSDASVGCPLFLTVAPLIQALRYQRELQKWEEENASPLDSYNESPIPAKSPIDANEYFGRWDSKTPSPVMQTAAAVAAPPSANVVANGSIMQNGHGPPPPQASNSLENRDLYDG